MQNKAVDGAAGLDQDLPAPPGGGVYAGGDLSITNSNISSNTADASNGFYNADPSGGGALSRINRQTNR